MSKDNLEIIKKTVEELLEKMDYDSKVEIKQSKEGDRENIVCNVAIQEDSHILIGQYGINLQALQHIARLLVRKKTEERVRFVVDVNSYLEQKNQSIIEQARSVAEQAINEGRAIVMRPMSPYERRIIHIELADNPKIVTESIGEAEGRKVVIKPAKEI